MRQTRNVKIVTEGRASWPDSSSSGFTLIELAVVLAILAVVLGLTVNLVESAFYGNDLKSSLRRLQGIVNAVRYEAMLDGRSYELVIETHSMSQPGRSQYWTVPVSETEPEGSIRKRFVFRPGSARLVRVETESQKSTDSSSARLRFSSNGLAEPARFHILAGGQAHVLVQEPFITRLEVLKRTSTDIGSQ